MTIVLSLSLSFSLSSFDLSVFSLFDSTLVSCFKVSGTWLEFFESLVNFTSPCYVLERIGPGRRVKIG